MRFRLTLVLSSILLSSGCSSINNHGSDFDNLPNIYDRREGQVALTDEQIEIKAREDLSNDPIIPYQSHVNVNAYNGTLLVTGQTLDEKVHKQIIDNLRIIQGVKRVQDEMVIAPETHASTQSNDSRMTNRIKTELDKVHHPTNFSSANITVITENGSVYLMGLVYKDEADMAASVIQKMQGVKKVIKLFEYLQ